MSSIIQNVHAREVLDSRGNPTVEVDVLLESQAKGQAIVPSGASTGKKEALELRDKDQNRYLGRGVLKAIENVNTHIKQNIIGLNALNQTEIDRYLLELDNTENKSYLGANAMLGVSMAVAKAAANHLNLPLYKYLRGPFSYILPVPMMNIINGGIHANNSLDFQEFMIIPVAYPTFKDCLRQGVEIFHALKSLLNDNTFSTSVGDEGGFAPSFKTHEEALEFIMRAIEKAKYKPGEDTYIALDIASSEFYKEGQYVLDSSQKKISSDELIKLYNTYLNKFPIISIEDGMAEDDLSGWKNLMKELGSKIQWVGDDLFVTNPKILQEGIHQNLANSILIKINQIGTLTETFNTIDLAQKNKYTTIISHRSGESEDVTISDIAVATNAGQIKTGSLNRTDRIAKYNQLLRIEEDLGQQATYLGKKCFPLLSK